MTDGELNIYMQFKTKDDGITTIKHNYLQKSVEYKVIGSNLTWYSGRCKLYGMDTIGGFVHYLARQRKFGRLQSITVLICMLNNDLLRSFQTGS